MRQGNCWLAVCPDYVCPTLIVCNDLPAPSTADGKVNAWEAPTDPNKWKGEHVRDVVLFCSGQQHTAHSFQHTLLRLCLPCWEAGALLSTLQPRYLVGRKRRSLHLPSRGIIGWESTWFNERVVGPRMWWVYGGSYGGGVFPPIVVYVY